MTARRLRWLPLVLTYSMLAYSQHLNPVWLSFRSYNYLPFTTSLTQLQHGAPTDLDGIVEDDRWRQLVSSSFVSFRICRTVTTHAYAYLYPLFLYQHKDTLFWVLLAVRSGTSCLACPPIPYIMPCFPVSTCPVMLPRSPARTSVDLTFRCRKGSSTAPVEAESRTLYTCL